MCVCVRSSLKTHKIVSFLCLRKVGEQHPRLMLFVKLWIEERDSANATQPSDGGGENMSMKEQPSERHSKKKKIEKEGDLGRKHKRVFSGF